MLTWRLPCGNPSVCAPAATTGASTKMNSDLLPTEGEVCATLRDAFGVAMITEVHRANMRVPAAVRSVIFESDSGVAHRSSYGLRVSIACLCCNSARWLIPTPLGYLSPKTRRQG